jgi:hypothetical protein
VSRRHDLPSRRRPPPPPPATCDGREARSVSLRDEDDERSEPPGHGSPRSGPAVKNHEDPRTGTSRTAGLPEFGPHAARPAYAARTGRSGPAARQPPPSHREQGHVQPTPRRSAQSRPAEREPGCSPTRGEHDPPVGRPGAERELACQLQEPNSRPMSPAAGNRSFTTTASAVWEKTEHAPDANAMASARPHRQLARGREPEERREQPRPQRGR